MTGVFYPYLAGAGKWEELRYSLRSLEQYFEEDFEVWIVGDLPDWIQGVEHLPHWRNHRLEDASTCDAIAKLELFINHPDTPDPFLRMYDDIYLLSPRKLEDLQVTRYLYSWEEFKRVQLSSGSVVWRENVSRTLNQLIEKGFPGYMTETHCPELFRKSKMREVFNLFRPGPENRLLTSTLYYNVFPFFRLLKDRKTERALFYGEESGFSYSSDGGIEEKLEGKHYLNHNDAGLNEKLMNYISGRFPKKSRFEK